MTTHDGLDRLIATMAQLRSPEGCPWDGEQTHESLVPYLAEEVFELIEALESGSRADVVEELGDVLYQILFHADIGASDPRDPFTIDDVARAVDHKMRSRHPHVFAGGDASTVAEVTKRWGEIKAEEKKHRQSPFEGIPEKLSALARAHSVLTRAPENFATPSMDGVPLFRDEAHLGEFLMGVVAQSRAQKFDAERALRRATREREADGENSGEAGGDVGRDAGGDEQRGNTDPSDLPE